MVRIAMLGAGSFFTHTLSKDIMQIDGIEGGEIRLVDVDPERLRLARGLVQKLAEVIGCEGAWTITGTTDRTEALDGVDFVVNTIEVSGIEAVRSDNDIPLEYGISQCIGDTIGPGGIFKALRTVPVWLDVLADVERLSPGVPVLNYTNPMSIMTHAGLATTDLPIVGLCHSVQGTSKKLARWAEVPYEEMVWECAGLNHNAWFVRLEHNGEDLYPRLKEKARTDEEMWEEDPVRLDMMLEFGYFVTESSGHFSEYVPYYRKRQDLREEYLRACYKGQESFYADEWPKWRADADKKRQAILDGERELEVGGRSHEYASGIIEGIVLDKPFVFHGSTMNTSLIDNLRSDGVVEVPIYTDKTGMSPMHVGSLPEQCAALNRAHMSVNHLVVEACIEGDREKAVHALMLDPLTAAVCSPHEVREMFNKMYDAQKDLLKPFMQRG